MSYPGMMPNQNMMMGQMLQGQRPGVNTSPIGTPQWQQQQIGAMQASGNPQEQAIAQMVSHLTARPPMPQQPMQQGAQPMGPMMHQDPGQMMPGMGNPMGAQGVPMANRAFQLGPFNMGPR